MKPSLTALALVGALGLAHGVVIADDIGSPRVGDERILLRTNVGDLVIALYPDVAPRHCAQIVKLARLGVYDSSWFYRVEPGFVAQLTDAQNRRVPMTAEQAAAIQKIPGELSSLKHRRGGVSMARQDNDLNSAETSFSFLLSNAPHLNGKYTIFGHLESGADVLDAIARAPRDAKNTPKSPIIVDQALVKTTDELKQMRLVGFVPMASDSQPSSHGAGRRETFGILVMMTFSLVGFLFAGRWLPRTIAAFQLLTILVGAFLLVAAYVPQTANAPALAVAIFVGIIGLLKLMNRFESPTRQPPTEPPKK